jgi:hypothetical protein
MARFKKGDVGNPSGGRRKTIPASKLPLITQLAARGVREKDIGRACDMSRDTWTRYRNANPEVAAAFEAGRQVMHDALVGKLYEKAMGGDTIALIFALKCFFGYRENAEVPELRAQVVINLPGAAALSDYKIVEASDA